MVFFNSFKKIKRNTQEAKPLILRENNLSLPSFFEKRRPALSNEKLKLFLDKGKAGLYWQGIELSKGIGLHTALNVNGNWYDSSGAVWQAKHISRDKLYVNISYRDIPVEEIWILSLTEENELSWEAQMLVKGRFEIKEKKIGIFVSEIYKRWFNASEEGDFPDGFHWEKIFLNLTDSRWFGVKPEGEYPGILFEVEAQGNPLLQNSNEELKCRAVQFELCEGGNNCSYTQGQNYKLFSGKIKIIEQEQIIDNYIENSKPLSLDTESFYFFGDSEETHDKIAASTNDFQEKVARIKQALAKNRKINIKIGVSRFNFFRIKEIAEFCLGLSGKTVDFSQASLSLFPVQKLYLNFAHYLEEIKSKIDATQIKLVLTDEDLFDILSIVSSNANFYNEKKLLRLLGVIAEHAFIGPQTVVVDPHHRCNVNCLHCWVHTPGIKHAAEFLETKLDFDMYKKMIDDFAQLMVDKIIFQGDGEPLLYNKFFDMVKYAREKGIDVLFFTNGLLLDKKVAEEVVALGVNQIFCSLPAGTAKTYSLVTHRQDPDAFQKVLDNLKYLSAVKSRENKKNPSLLLTHVIHSENYKELLEMAKNDVDIGADVIRFYLIRLADHIKFLQLKPEEVEYIRHSILEVKNFLKDKRVELLDTTDFQLSNIRNDSATWSKGVFLREGCLSGWFFCLVPALGDISLCCHTRTVGYLKEKSFKDIWASKEYARYRAQAKYLKENKDVTFLNGVKLYDDHCEHCDTHQVIRDINEELKNYKLDRYVFN